MDFANRIDATNENIVSDAREGTANAFCLLACVFSCPDGNEASWRLFLKGRSPAPATGTNQKCLTIYLMING